MEKNSLELMIYKVSFTLIVLIIATRHKGFKHILQKREYDKHDLNKIGFIFGMLGILAAYCSINVYGAISTTRRIIILSCILLYGTRPGIIALIMVIIHRVSIDLYTLSIVLEISEIIFASMIMIAINPYIPENRKAIIGTFVSMITVPLASVVSIIISDRDPLVMEVVRNYTLSITLCQLGVLFFVRMIQDMQMDRIILEQEVEIEKLKSEVVKSEMRALQAQINPHFLFNALNIISILVKRNPVRSRELIFKLSSYLRYNLELKTGLIDIYKEIEQVKCYLEIEQERFRNKIEVEYNIEEDIDIKIPSLIIQPLVENAVIHGILNSKSSGKIFIDIKKIEDRCNICIRNRGIPIDDEIIESVHSDNVDDSKVGLYNVHSRIKFLYKEGLKITRLEDGTKIEFDIYKIEE